MVCSYIGWQPTRGIVHLTAVGNTRFKFISIERRDFVENGGFPVKGRNDIIVIPVQELITQEVIKSELSKLRGCSVDEVEVHVNVRHDKARKHQRMVRYGHGPDPAVPPPGWDPR